MKVFSHNAFNLLSLSCSQATCHWNGELSVGIIGVKVTERLARLLSAIKLIMPDFTSIVLIYFPFMLLGIFSLPVLQPVNEPLLNAQISILFLYGKTVCNTSVIAAFAYNLDTPVLQ